MSELRPAPREQILLIEEDGPLRKVLRRLFSLEGYEVDVAPDAVCGLERLRVYPDPQESTATLSR